jgi:hypothetical protein
MGLFDFFKKKEQPEKEPAAKNGETYLGDLDKTNMIYHLVKTPPAERDDQWQNTFLQNIAQASFRCGDPQLQTGPDGFPYFQLHLPEPNKSFQCYVIDRMKDDFLLTKGFGVVINPAPNSADWVLSYGDILNFHLNQTFYTTEETPFSKEVTDETISGNEEVMIGQPSEALLPKQARKVIGDFLKMNNVKNPKILLMMRPKKDGPGVSQDLVFNITPKNFDNENTYRNVMRTIGWYLPRHYSFVGMDEKTLGSGFENL